MSHSHSSRTEYRIDEVDKRILYYLATDARKTGAPDIADEVDVTAATIRNRIRRLEDRGILVGYLANIDYKSIDGYVTYQFRCTAPIPERKRLAQTALEVPGVISTRELMDGSSNLVITAVGPNTDNITQVALELSNLGLDINDESVIKGEHHSRYTPFGPEEVPKGPSLTEFMSLASGAEVVEFTVSEGAEVAGLSIKQAVADGLLTDELLVVGIGRDGDMLTPKGETVIQTGDVVSVLSKENLNKSTLAVFGG